MNGEGNQASQDEVLERHARRRRLKRCLRLLPRRATLKRHPLLKRFHRSVITREYLWTFRPRTVVPAIYAGCLVTFQPLAGVQLPVTVLVAVLLRANVLVMGAIQTISNPVTGLAVFAWTLWVGDFFLAPLGVGMPPGALEQFRETGLQWRDLALALRALGVASAGGIVTGLALALPLHLAYRVLALRHRRRSCDRR